MKPITIVWARNESMKENNRRMTSEVCYSAMAKIYISEKRKDVDIAVDEYTAKQFGDVWMVGAYLRDGSIILKRGGNTEAGFKKWGNEGTNQIRSTDLYRLVKERKISLPPRGAWRKAELVYFADDLALRIPPVVKRKNLHDKDELYAETFECSKCKERIYGKTNFCPKCGTRLED